MKWKRFAKSPRTKRQIFGQSTQVVVHFGFGGQLLRRVIVLFADHFENNVTVAVLIDSRHHDFGIEELFADDADQSSDNSTETFAFAVVMQMQGSVWRVSDPEGWRPHAWVDWAQVVVQVVQVGQEVRQIAAQYA